MNAKNIVAAVVALLVTPTLWATPCSPHLKIWERIIDSKDRIGVISTAPSTENGCMVEYRARATNEGGVMTFTAHATEVAYDIGENESFKSNQKVVGNVPGKPTSIIRGSVQHVFSNGKLAIILKGTGSSVIVENPIEAVDSFDGWRVGQMALLPLTNPPIVRPIETIYKNGLVELESLDPYFPLSKLVREVPTFGGFKTGDSVTRNGHREIYFIDNLFENGYAAIPLIEYKGTPGRHRLPDHARPVLPVSALTLIPRDPLADPSLFGTKGLNPRNKIVVLQDVLEGGKAIVTEIDDLGKSYVTARSEISLFTNSHPQYRVGEVYANSDGVVRELDFITEDGRLVFFFDRIVTRILYPQVSEIAGIHRNTVLVDLFGRHWNLTNIFANGFVVVIGKDPCTGVLERNWGKLYGVGVQDASEDEIRDSLSKDRQAVYFLLYEKLYQNQIKWTERFTFTPLENWNKMTQDLIDILSSAGNTSPEQIRMREYLKTARPERVCPP